MQGPKVLSEEIWIRTGEEPLGKLSEATEAIHYSDLTKMDPELFYSEYPQL
jgi:hypothetical protein